MTDSACLVLLCVHAIGCLCRRHGGELVLIALPFADFQIQSFSCGSF